MLDIHYGEGRHVLLVGRVGAAQAATAQALLDEVSPPCVIDAGGLEYISSAGLGVLLKTHKRLVAAGSGICLVNVNLHVYDVFRYSGMDKLFPVTCSTATQG